MKANFCIKRKHISTIIFTFTRIKTNTNLLNIYEEQMSKMFCILITEPLNNSTSFA